jgi:hypothetical protein
MHDSLLPAAYQRLQRFERELHGGISLGHEVECGDAGWHETATVTGALSSTKSGISTFSYIPRRVSHASELPGPHALLVSGYAREITRRDDQSEAKLHLSTKESVYAPRDILALNMPSLRPIFDQPSGLAGVSTCRNAISSPDGRLHISSMSAECVQEKRYDPVNRDPM